MTRRAPRCLVKGSINIDEVYALPRIVRPGETISSTSYSRKAGGKGANQAYALAKAGAAVDLDATVGQDGQWVKEELRAAGVGPTSVSVHPDEPTGRAIIQVAVDGENAIVLHKGANFASGHDTPAVQWEEYTHLVVQNEIPWATTLEYLDTAHSREVNTIFNPSPMPCSADLKVFPWHAVDWLIVNAGELDDLLTHLGVSGGGAGASVQEQAMSSCGALRDSLGLPGLSIVCTLGAAGVVYVEARPDKVKSGFVPSAKLQRPLRNTSGAGDCLAGYFVSGLMRSIDDLNIEDILRTCVVACAICVEEDEAMRSIPSLDSVNRRVSDGSAANALSADSR